MNWDETKVTSVAIEEPASQQRIPSFLVDFNCVTRVAISFYRLHRNQPPVEISTRKSDQSMFAVIVTLHPENHVETKFNSLKQKHLHHKV